MNNQGALAWLQEAESRALEFLETATAADVAKKIDEYHEQMAYAVTVTNKDSWKFTANMEIDPELEYELNFEMEYTFDEPRQCVSIPPQSNVYEGEHYRDAA